ncbi:ABC transporter involved in cytochrome c biogenesis, ATPase component CcmA [hydrothermal vent metagenome]|uniref:ABC transporter involved in cytochrome c biogenesis, ATPase component CcmA n=1 Tax=hydrothermal vent metagenome TaxID=652676 RepID=A0A3B1AM48_9ZZZZ
MLEIANLACSRGDRQLFTGLNFALEPGSLLYVEGRNGTGKTTLLRTICGLFLQDEGEVLWNGETASSLAEDYIREVVYLGHHNGIKSDLTGLENLRVSTVLDGDDVSEEQIWAALKKMGLAGFEDLPTQMLSQGQKRRVALARLLLNSSKLWILDEPFTALDVAAVDLLQTVIAEHIENGGMVILTTHQEVALTSGQVQRLELGNRKQHV